MLCRGPANDDVTEMAFKAIGNKTVEGYHTLKPIYRFVSEKNMFAPIVRELYDILYDAKKPEKAPRMPLLPSD